jgi:hypothetical protein
MVGVMATSGSEDFQALVHLVDRTVGSLGRLQAIVDDTLDKLEALQHQLHTMERRESTAESGSSTVARH